MATAIASLFLIGAGALLTAAGLVSCMLLPSSAQRPARQRVGESSSGAIGGELPELNHGSIPSHASLVVRLTRRGLVIGPMLVMAGGILRLGAP